MENGYLPEAFITFLHDLKFAVRSLARTKGLYYLNHVCADGAGG